jgi:hypothetical protein
MSELLDIFAEFATDENLENNGTWFPLGGKARVLVARSGNRAYAKSLSAEVNEHQATLDLDNEAADTLSEQIMARVMSKTILLGFENFAFKGKAISYSHENAEKLLMVKDFRRQIVKFSETVSAYKANLEAAQGEA